LGTPPLDGLFGGRETTHTQKERENGALALSLSGQNFKGRHNNQPKVGVWVGVGIREEAWPSWSSWGASHHQIGQQFEGGK